jgi:hypothetical protein
MFHPRRRGSPLVRVASALACSIAIYLVFHLLRSREPTPLQQYITRHSYPQQRAWLKSPNLPLLAPGPIRTKHSPKLSRASRRATTPPPISINSSLPSLDGLRPSSRLVQAWNSSLDSVVRAARLQIERHFDENFLREISGVPGTNITTDEEASRLQGYLDCVTSRGSWVYDRSGKDASKRLTVHKQDSVFATCDRRFYKGRVPREYGGETSDDWDVRESLKFRWLPDKSCAALLPNHLKATSMSPNRLDFCRLLRHKNIMAIGDGASTYLMHDLLLDWTRETPISCYGDLYCAGHALCTEGLRDGTNIEGEWDSDMRVFNPLPDPSAADASRLSREHAKRDEPTTDGKDEDHHRHVVETRAAPNEPGAHRRSGGTLLRFKRSDGLFIDSHPDHERLGPVYAHPWTGVREINVFAHTDVRRSDVIVASKPPLPLPEVHAPAGNWTRAFDRGAWVGEGKAILAIEAARTLTEQVWLPELMESLAAFRKQPVAVDQLLVWKGGWRIQPDCSTPDSDLEDEGYGFDGRPGSFDWHAWWESPGDGPPPLSSLPSLRRIVYSGPASGGLLSDRDSLFYNLQTVLQNHLLRTEVLPRLGMVYLDLETPMAIWRSGLVGSRDCLRPCLPSPGLSLENAFVGGLQTVFAWGWDGEGRKETWLGRDYVPFKDREAGRKRQKKKEEAVKRGHGQA